MLFVSQIEGPTSEEDFTHECAEMVLPGLSERNITAAAWTTPERNGFYLHGCVEGDPSGDVSDVVEQAGWAAQTLLLQGLRNVINLPSSRPIKDCVMPFNNEGLGNRPYKTCSAQSNHKILDAHAVINCPVCGGLLT